MHQRFRQPRLELVCFKTWRTVSYDTDSTTCSATSRSASSRTLQRLWPSGGGAAGQRDQAGLLLTVELAAVFALGWLGVQRGVQPGGGVVLAHPGHGGGGDLQRLGDHLVGPARAGLALVGFEQDAGMGQGTGRTGVLADQGVKPGAFGLGQDNGVALAHARLLAAASPDHKEHETTTHYANHD
jgi:hypothetical protein